jgi:hypothetical protein
MRFTGFAFVFVLFSVAYSFSQPIVIHKYGDTIVYYNHHISLGTKHNGIGFGNFIHYNGLKLSFFDEDTLTNGISIAISQRRQPKKTNGIEIGGNISVGYITGAEFGIINSVYERLTGFSFAVLYDYNWRTNGVAVAAIFRMNDYLNGVSIAGLADVHHLANGLMITGANEMADSLNGVALSGIAINTGNSNGVTIAPLNFTKTGHGVQIGILNYARDYKGIQIGLINIIKTKKHLKFLPFVNFK